MYGYIVQAASNTFMDDPMGFIGSWVAGVIAWFIGTLINLMGLLTLAEFAAKKFSSTMVHLNPRNWLIKAQKGGE